MASHLRNSTFLDSLVQAAISGSIDDQREMDPTNSYSLGNITSYSSKIDTFVNATLNASATSTISSVISTLSTTEVPGDLSPQNSESSTTVKITTLMVITAFVLVISYCSVVRLFLGYADRKDDVYPDGPSDDEEDSAVIKRMEEYDMDM